MTVHSAYCVPCDMKVEVSVEGKGEGGELTAADVRCPAQGEACRAGSCLLARMSPLQMRRQMEFLPPVSDPRPPRGLEEAAGLVEVARRRSLAREVGRYRRWWRREGSGGASGRPQ